MRLLLVLLALISLSSCSIEEVGCPIVDNKYRDRYDYFLELDDYTVITVSETTYKNYNRGDEYCQ